MKLPSTLYHFKLGGENVWLPFTGATFFAMAGLVGFRRGEGLVFFGPPTIALCRITYKNLPQRLYICRNQAGQVVEILYPSPPGTAPPSPLQRFVILRVFHIKYKK